MNIGIPKMQEIYGTHEYISYRLFHKELAPFGKLLSYS